MNRVKFGISFFVAVMVITQYACIPKNTHKQAEKHILEKDYQGAVNAYQAVIDAQPGTSDARQAQLGIAKLYIEKMDHPQQGVQAYQDLIAANPDSDEAAEAHYRLGVYYFKAKDYESAQKSFDTIVNQFPNFERSHNAQLMLAKSYEEAQDYEKAAEIYDNVANRHPEGERAVQALIHKAELQKNYLQNEMAARRTYQSLVKRYGKNAGTEHLISEAKRELQLMGATIPKPDDPLASQYDRYLERRRQRRERDRPRGGVERSRAMGAVDEFADSGFGVDAKDIMQTYAGALGSESGVYYDTMLKIADLNLDIQNYRDAGALYFRAIELAKRENALIEPYSYLRLATCYRKLGMHRRANEVVREAVKKDHRVIDAVITSATNQYLDRDYEKAIGTYSSVVGLNRGKDPELYWRLSLAYQKMGNYPKEAESCERAIAIKTDYVDALQSLAYVLYRHLNQKELAGVFEDHAKGSSNTYAGEKALGDICYKYGNYGWAKSKYSAAARIAQRETQAATTALEKRTLGNQAVYAHVHAAMAAYKSGAADKAQQMIDALPTEYPDHALIAYGHGQLGLLKGDTDAAITAFKASMEKDPRADAAPLALGEHYRSQGLVDEAIALWEAFLKINWRSKAVRHRLNELKKQVDGGESPQNGDDASTTSDQKSE
ncbi:MAG: tetratricopeptide repeat protein [Candidatus Poribacteria bacterium]|nr:tetratricopeptide repeat protein [Candidatus Poribacteria bacterium]